MSCWRCTSRASIAAGTEANLPDALQGETMKHLMTPLHFLVSQWSALMPPTLPSAPAASAKPKTAQQEKMGACATEAKGKKGDEYKAAMKTCLSAKKSDPARKDEVLQCRPEGQGREGDERKAFMKECLSK